MHPHTFYSTLYGHSKRDEVFVVMSFAAEFDARWCDVIEPVIREGLRLTPSRVDYNVSGESIVHDILDGVAHARLVIADITSTPMADDRGKLWPQRNGNVMWELGIAHVMRLPDEVIMVRSDNDPSIFDLTQFRAFQYDPSDVVASREFLLCLAKDRLRAIDQSKSDYVRKSADALDPYSIHFFLHQVPIDGRPFSIKLSMRNAMQVTRLFEVGLLRAASFALTTNVDETEKRVDIRYAITDLGRDVAILLSRRFSAPERSPREEDH